MSTSNNSEDTNPRKAGAKKAAGRKKGAPSHFNPSLVQGLIAGADDVAGRSFIGGGGAVTAPPPETPQADVAPAPAAPTSSAEAGTDLESSEPSVITAPECLLPQCPARRQQTVRAPQRPTPPSLKKWLLLGLYLPQLFPLINPSPGPSRAHRTTLWRRT